MQDEMQDEKRENFLKNFLDGVRVYPYVANKKEGGYDQVCGYYKPESFRKIIREDRGGWI